MTLLSELKPGDKVAVSDSGGRYSIVTVTRVTATQITAGDERYNKRDGVKIGSGSGYSYFGQRPRIAMGGKFPYDAIMTLEEAEKAIASQQVQMKRSILIRKIKASDFNPVSLKDLEAIEAIIKRASEVQMAEIKAMIAQSEDEQ